MCTQNLNNALLDLTLIINRCFPATRRSDLGTAIKASVDKVLHAALASQLGQVDGDPRDFLKLALQECAAHGFVGMDIMDIINAHQEATTAPRRAVGGGS